jgi:hypothetical protein
MKDGKYVIPTVRSNDQIVYLCKTKPGGVDGRDSTDNGGKVTFATFDKDQALAINTGWVNVEATVVNVEDAVNEALKKLTPLDKLVLGFLPEHRVTR